MPGGRDLLPRAFSFAQRLGDMGAAAPLACAALALSIPGSGKDVILAAEGRDRLGAIVLDR